MSRKEIRNYGKLFQPRFDIVAPVGSPYVVLQNDFLILCGGAFVVTLPLVATCPGRVLVIKETITTGAVTITPSGGQTIDGAATLVISGQGKAVMIQADDGGGTWRVLSDYNDLVNYQNIRTVTGTPTVGFSDAVLLCNSAGGNVLINLPAAANNTGRIITCKKTSAANIVTLDANAAELIDGALTLVMDSLNQAFSVICDGTGWQVV